MVRMNMRNVAQCFFENSDLNIKNSASEIVSRVDQYGRVELCYTQLLDDECARKEVPPE